MKKYFHDKCFKDVVTNKTMTWVTFLHEPEVDGGWRDFSGVVKLEYPGHQYKVIREGNLEGLEIMIEIRGEDLAGKKGHSGAPAPAKKRKAA